MKKWPDFNETGDLPVGIHRGTLEEAVEDFGKGSLKRAILAHGLEMWNSQEFRKLPPLK